MFRSVFLALFALLAVQSAAANDIQLVAVQLELDINDYWTPASFEQLITGHMAKVAERTATGVPTLVVFPEDVGLLLAISGMEKQLAGIDSIEKAIGKAVSSNAIPLLWTRLIRWKSWVPALFLHRQKIIAEAYFETFAAVAREHEVYIVAGSVILPPYEIENGRVRWDKKPTEHNVYNTSYLFGPDGLVIGKQDKIDLIELEQEAALNLSSGTFADLQVFETEVGAIGIAICLDAFSSEITQQLAALGADILVQPSANPGPWNEWQQTDWLRSTQLMVGGLERFAYGVNPMLVGPLWDIEFFGQSSIAARAAQRAELGYTDVAPEPGFISVAETADKPEILVVRVPHPASL